MGAKMAKPRAGRRQLGLEAEFEAGRDGRDAVGRAYERLLPSLAREAKGPSEGVRHEEPARGTGT
jgi:hypothetical protein